MSDLSHLSETLVTPDAITAGTLFVSYSRKNRDFARALYDKLRRMGFKLWRDVQDIEAGAEDWWQTIQEAIRECDTLILCMSMPALESPVVGDEWLYARTLGKRIIPVVADDIWTHPKVVGGQYTLPNWMTRKNWLDFRAGVPENTAAWANLIRTLNESYTPKRFINMVGELPPRFVRRAAELDRAVRALVDDQNDAIAMTTALKGAGGYGKTTLAKAVARDVRVQGAFDDGVLWVTLGAELLNRRGDDLDTALIGRVADLIQAIDGARPTFVTLDAARAGLAAAIGDRYILLVVDDVWDAAHLQPFLVKGKHHSALITTRTPDALPGGIAQQAVDRMTPPEAVELLSAGLDPDAARPLETALRQLARDLREYPLLLGLVNAQITTLMNDLTLPLDEALALAREMLKEQGVLGFDDADTAERARAFGQTIGISLGRLTEDEQARYRMLAVFAEDALIPLSTLERLWGLSPVQTLQFCLKLYRKAALLHSFEGKQARLHDVFRDYLRRLHGGGLPALHARLIEAWGSPYTLPDAYAWAYYAYHLVEAGQRARLYDRLFDRRWLQNKLEAADPNALIADCETWRGAGSSDADETERAVRLLQSALGMSAHILTRDTSALAHQLSGRLTSHRRDSAALRAFTDSLMQTPGLHPAHPDSDYPILEQAGGPLLRTLTGHTSGVNAVAATGDGRLVSASDDGTLKVWDLTTYAELATLTSHTKAVRGVAVTEDGRLVSASADRTLKVWDLATYRELATLTGHTGSVNAVAATGDGRLVSASDDGTLKVWDLAIYTELATLTGRKRGVYAVAVTGDGRLVSPSADRTLKVWDLTTYTELATLTSHTVGVKVAVAATGDGRLVSTSGGIFNGGKLKVWDLATYRELATLTGHTRDVNAVAATGDGRLVSASYDNTLKVWDLATYTELATLTGHTSYVTAVAVTGDGRAVSASADKTLKVWDLTSGPAAAALTGHTSYVTAVAVTGDGRLVSASGDIVNAGELKVWDLTTYTELATLTGHTVGVNAVAVTGDGRLVSASGDNTLKVWDLATYTKLATLTGHTRGVKAVAVTGDGRLVSASGDIFNAGELKVWDLTTYTELATLTGHTRGVTAVTGDGRLVSASDDNTLKVWDLTTYRELATLTGHTREVNAVAVTEDGRAVSASWDKSLKVWDLATYREVASFPDDDEGRAALRRSFPAAYFALYGAAAGGRIVAREGDRLSLYTADGAPLERFYADGYILSIAITPDGQMVVAGDEAGRVLFLRWVG